MAVNLPLHAPYDISEVRREVGGGGRGQVPDNSVVVAVNLPIRGQHMGQHGWRCAAVSNDCTKFYARRDMVSPP